jgi:translation initiation factor IF-2
MPFFRYPFNHLTFLEKIDAMNVTELARRLRVNTDELFEKLPDLGFSIGRKAIKIDNRQAQRIIQAWSEMKRKERLAEKMERQKALGSRADRQVDPSTLKPLMIPEIVTVRDFATKMELPVPRVMQELMKNGILASLNERIDFDTATIIAEDLGFKAEMEAGDKENEEQLKAMDRVRETIESEDKEVLEMRAPVVVVMGHVDHGKTKLLDAIRNTNVVDTEAGGITQHIGAYQVERKGQHLTFIDTPGHEAFTVMRSRGAKVADIAIIVVAVDDGVQPQTKEAINIAQSAGIPFLIALNKIDREQANIEKVKGELAELKLVSEDWGGKTVMVPISAKQQLHIEDLLDMLLLTYEMEKEKIVANPNRPAIGTVIESHVNPGSGPVATVLVQGGTLRAGDTLGVRQSLYGRVRRMEDWTGEQIDEAPPSTPTKIIGWKLAPAVGDILEVPEEGVKLKRIKSTDVSHQATEEVAAIKGAASSGEGEESEKKYLNLIIRSDVLGSLEAILGMFDKIQHDQVGVKVIQKGLGNITDADIQTAEAGKAMVVGFNVHPVGTAGDLARDLDVEVREYQIIYKLFDDVLEKLEEILPSETTLVELGKLGVLATFKKTEKGYIVGGQVRKGKILPKAKVRLQRDGEYIGEGKVVSLQLGRSQIKEAHEGQECGMEYHGKAKPEEGDIMEFYSEEREDRTLVIEGVSKR